MNVWKSWAESKGLNNDIVKYEAKELDECLSRFFAEVRKSDGSDYEPDSLRVMLAALDRHLKQNHSKISIAKDREFVKCRQVLEGKTRALRKKGYGKRPEAYHLEAFNPRSMLPIIPSQYGAGSNMEQGLPRGYVRYARADYTQIRFT